MSLHNTVEVLDDAGKGAQTQPYTRDRFGKKHSVENVLNKKVLVSSLFLIFLTSAAGFAEGLRNTNISVDSSEIGPISINEKIKTKQDKGKQSLQLDENVALGFNDDGDPNVGMRF